MLVFGENQPLHVKFLALKKNFWPLFFSAAKVVIIQGYALIQQLLHSRPAASFLEGFKWEFVGGWFLRLKKMEVNETFCFVTFRPINFGTISFPIKYFPKKIHLSFGWVPYRWNIRLQKHPNLHPTSALEFQFDKCFHFPSFHCLTAHNHSSTEHLPIESLNHQRLLGEYIPTHLIILISKYRFYSGTLTLIETLSGKH